MHGFHFQITIQDSLRHQRCMQNAICILKRISVGFCVGSIIGYLSVNMLLDRG